jgi:hypothetical protein
MKLEAAISFCDQRISEVERAIFTFDEIVAPRAEMDRKILRQLRDARIKMLSLKEKIDDLQKRRAAGEDIPANEEITREEFMNCLPQAFR